MDPKNLVHLLDSANFNGISFFVIYKADQGGRGGRVVKGGRGDLWGGGDRGGRGSRGSYVEIIYYNYNKKWQKRPDWPDLQDTDKTNITLEINICKEENIVCNFHLWYENLKIIWVLLDNQSTVDIVCNSGIITNIRESPHPKNIRSHGRTRTATHISNLTGYPHLVYFDLDEIENILSLSKVRDVHRVTYDSKNCNVFTINPHTVKSISSSVAKYYTIMIPLIISCSPSL